MKFNTIKKIYLFSIFFLISFFTFSIGKETISKTEIKIGEKIHLTIIIQNLENIKVLWEDLSSTYNNVEILSKKDYYKGKSVFFEVVFTFFESGEYSNLYFTIPISQSNGEMLYLYSEKYKIKVNNPLTSEEIENIKNIKNPSDIELKKEKEQANIPFYFSFYYKIIILILLIFIITFITYYYFYKYIMKIKQSDKSLNIPPYHKFLAKLEMILFDNKDDRKTIEKKVSELTELLKDLIADEFSLNAPTKTTNELITSLKKIRFDEDIIKEIKILFNEIDMIKFAKAPINFDRLNFYLKSIKKLGNKIHNYKLSLEPNENQN